MSQPLKRPFHNDLEKCTVVNPEASTYSLVICHNDSHIARSFRATIEALKSNQYQLTQHFYD